MKRLFSILLIALLAISAIPTMAAEDTMVYSFAAESGKVGDTIKITISVKNAPEIASYMTTLYYDSAVLEPTGQSQKMNMGGMMVFNPKAPQEVEGKGTIKIACATVSDKSIISGDMDLLNFSFKIIGTPADEKGSLIEIASHSFSQNDANLSKVPSLQVQPCRVQVLPEDAVTPEQPDDTPEQKPAPEIPEEQKPTGDWQIVPEANQAVHTDKDENGKEVDTGYITEFEKNEEGKITGVILYDEEKNQVGRLEVEEDEYGNLNVIKQFFDQLDQPPVPTKDSAKPWYFWALIGLGGAVVLTGIALLVYFFFFKKEEKSKKNSKKR